MPNSTACSCSSGSEKRSDRYWFHDRAREAAVERVDEVGAQRFLADRREQLDNGVLYVNYKPGSDLDPLRREFIRYVFSKGGQQDVLKSGYLPVGTAVANKSLRAVGIK